MMETFDLEVAFLEYLIMVDLDINTISEVQLTESKRAFYAGLSLMHQLYEKAWQDPDPYNAKKVVDDMEDQCTIFWAEQLKKSDHKSNSN